MVLYIIIINLKIIDMKNSMYKIIATLFILVLGINISNAAFFKSDSEVKINDEIEGNTYLAGEKVDYDTKVNGDLFIAGQYIDVKGEITKDINLAGQFIETNADIGEDLRIAGQDIKISNKINGETIIFGETINLEETSELIGDTLIYAKTININGTILGNTNLKAENIIINGNLNGENNQLVSANLEISDNANINQDTKYWSENSQISSNLETNLILDSNLEIKKPESEKSSMLNISGLLVLRIIWASTIIIVLHLLFTKKIEKNLESLDSNTKYIENFFLGFFVIILIPVVAFALMLTILGFPLGAIILVLYFILLLISQSITSIYLSNLLNIKFDLKVEKIQIYLMSLGIYTLFLLMETVPYLDIIGGILSGMFFFIFMGNLVKNLRIKEPK